MDKAKPKTFVHHINNILCMWSGKWYERKSTCCWASVQQIGAFCTLNQTCVGRTQHKARLVSHTQTYKSNGKHTKFNKLCANKRIFIPSFVRIILLWASKCNVVNTSAGLFYTFISLFLFFFSIISFKLFKNQQKSEKEKHSM